MQDEIKSSDISLIRVPQKGHSRIGEGQYSKDYGYWNSTAALENSSAVLQNVMNSYHMSTQKLVHEYP